MWQMLKIKCYQLRRVLGSSCIILVIFHKLKDENRKMMAKQTFSEKQKAQKFIGTRPAGQEI